MKNRIKQLSILNKLILVSMFLILVTNPWSVGYIGIGLEKFIDYYTLYAVYGFVVGLVGLFIAEAIRMWQGREKINVPSKTQGAGRIGMKYEETK